MTKEQKSLTAIINKYHQLFIDYDGWFYGSVIQGQKLAEYEQRLCDTYRLPPRANIVILDVDGIHSDDHPEYCDAYCIDALVNGKQASEEQIEEINDCHSDLVIDYIHEDYMPGQADFAYDQMRENF